MQRVLVSVSLSRPTPRHLQAWLAFLRRHLLDQIVLQVYLVAIGGETEFVYGADETRDGVMIRRDDFEETRD